MDAICSNRAKSGARSLLTLGRCSLEASSIRPFGANGLDFPFLIFALAPSFHFSGER